MQCLCIDTDRCIPPFALPYLIVNPRNGDPVEGAWRRVRHCTSMRQQHVGRLRLVPHRLLGACCRRSSALSRNGYHRPGPHFSRSVRMRQPCASCLCAAKNRRFHSRERRVCRLIQLRVYRALSLPSLLTGADLSCTDKLSWLSLDLKQNAFGSTLVEVLPTCIALWSNQRLDRCTPLQSLDPIAAARRRAVKTRGHGQAVLDSSSMETLKPHRKVGPRFGLHKHEARHDGASRPCR